MRTIHIKGETGGNCFVFIPCSTELPRTLPWSMVLQGAVEGKSSTEQSCRRASVQVRRSSPWGYSPVCVVGSLKEKGQGVSFHFFLERELERGALEDKGAAGRQDPSLPSTQVEKKCCRVICQ